jgi:tetrahydromethanopterin S-methyltransferase subunit A
VPDLNTLTVEKLQAVIAEALQPAPEPVADVPAPAAPPAPPDEMQEDKALSAEAATRFAQTKALDLITQMVEDQGQIAESVTELTADVKAVKALKPIVEELARTMQEMQEQFNLRPRSASEADENVVDVQGKSKAAKTAQAIEADINRGLLGDTQKVLGVRVNG